MLEWNVITTVAAAGAAAGKELPGESRYAGCDIRSTDFGSLVNSRVRVMGHAVNGANMLGASEVLAFSHERLLFAAHKASKHY